MALHIVSVTPHPVARGSLRVKFSEAINGGSSTGSDPVADANTLALWRLDEASGTAADQTGTYPLSVVGSGVSYVAGLKGNAARILGVVGQNHHLTNAGDAEIRNAFADVVTWEGYVKIVSTYNDSWNCVFACDGPTPDTDMMMRIHFNGGFDYPGQKVMHVQWRGAGAYQTPMGATDVKWPDNEWMGVAVRKTAAGGGQYKVDAFINGSKVFTGSPVGNCVAANTQSLVLGMGTATQWGGGEMLLDSVRISNIARTDDEITSYYASHQPGYNASTITITGGVTVLSVARTAGTTDSLDVICSGLTRGVVYTVTASGISDSATSTAIASPGDSYVFGYFGTNYTGPSLIGLDGRLLHPVRSQHGHIKSDGAAAALRSMTLDAVSHPTQSSLILTFSDNVVLQGPALDPANWTIAGPGLGVTCTAVSAPSDQKNVTLTITDQTQGGAYTVTVPSTGISGPSALNFSGPFTMNFTGIGVAPSIVMARSVDARTMEVIFSEPVLESDALNPTNYTITNGLKALSVSKVTPVIYRLTTSKQAVGTAYNVTVSEVRDLQGNEI